MNRKEFSKLVKANGHEFLSALTGNEKPMLIKTEFGVVECTPKEYKWKYAELVQRDKPHYFYLQALRRLSRGRVSGFKYGITTKTVEERMAQQERVSAFHHEIKIAHHFIDGNKAILLERDIKIMLHSIGNRNVPRKYFPDGASETFEAKHLGAVLALYKKHKQ